MRKIFFITGLWGTGKTSLIESINLFPHYPFKFIDFDFGGGFQPPDDRSLHLDWRKKQTDYWLRFSQKLSIDEPELNPVICGVSLYPSQLLELNSAKFWSRDEFRFAYLKANDSIRKQRLIERENADMFISHKNWYDDFSNDLNEFNSKEFDTSILTKNEVAVSVFNWLLSEIK